MKISALTVEKEFDRIMSRAVEHRERFLVDWRGEPGVVIMSIDEYIRAIVPEHPALTAIHEESKRVGLDKITMEEIDEEIAAYRREKRAVPASV